MAERVTGIEPASRAWKARALPLSYTRAAAGATRRVSPAVRRTGRGGGGRRRRAGATLQRPVGRLSTPDGAHTASSGSQHPAERHAVTAAVDAVASYVPDLLVRRLRTVPESRGAPWDDQLAGAVLLADISGFTAITERLAEQGPAGAEALGGLLNGAFQPLLRLISEAGGEVLKFAGDALLACWPAGDDPAAGLRVAARRAARCALAMHTTLQRYAQAEGLRLRLRIGVGAGDVALLDVGGVYGRRE